MDLVKLKEILIDKWFLYEWRTRLSASFVKDRHSPFRRACFTVGDDHIELFNCIFLQKPCTGLDPKIGGDLSTLVLHTNFIVKYAKVKGQMRIRNPRRSPLTTEFQLELKTVEILQTIGFVIIEDDLRQNTCHYEFSNYDISFMYPSESGTVSVLDCETDASRRKFLEMYLVEILMKDFCPMVHEFEQRGLSFTQSVCHICYNNYQSRDILRKHNRLSHAAMKHLGTRIINLTSDLIKESSKKLHLPRIYGLTVIHKTLMEYQAYIGGLHSVTFEQIAEYHDEEVIISNQEDCLILYVPFKIWVLGVHYKEIVENPEDNIDEFKNKQIFTTEGAYFKLSLKKIAVDQVEIKLLRVKIRNIKPIDSNHLIEMTIDHLVFSAIEECITSMMEQTLNDKKLQELALNPKVHLEETGESSGRR